MKFARKFFKNPNYAEYWSDKVRTQGYKESYRVEFLEALQASPGESFLEVGVGEGRNLVDLVKSGVNYVGIDISNEMLLRTRESIPEPYTGKCDLLLADAMWLPFREFSFDKALSFATLFFVPDQAKAISEIQSVARQRIAIEFRNSRNPKVYLYGKASTFSVFARPLLHELVRRDGVRKSLGLLLGRSRAQKLSDQILVYGSLQPVFGMNTAI
ncbi:methyltransferase domain-containing protein, partial [Candidatus Bathyarchaeota archaeon]